MYTKSEITFKNLKIDYYEKLIKKGVKDAENYKERIDNGNFFKNLNTSIILDYGRFDFIIVGAGSAGCVLANRLSEINKWKILLLEAGGEEDDLSQIPGLHNLMPTSDKNWGYTSTPQQNACLGMVENRCLYPRGQILGGSGAINGLVYVRGNKKNFDEWEKLGNPGWSFDEILPYFKKSENSQIKNGDKGYHGFAGPINDAYSKPDMPFKKFFEDAHKELGFKVVDYNGKHQVGVSRTQTNIKHGKRVDGGNSYVKPARNRINLNVTLHSLVTKILIDQKTNQAHGVLFIKNGKMYEATACKEVILSGGSINTPQLLMLSGIGPKQHLEELGIEVINDLQVGQTMKDHLAFSQVFVRTNYTEPTITLRQQIKDYFKGKGMLTTSSLFNSVSLLNVYDHKSPDPNVEILIVPPSGKEGEEASPRSYNKEAQCVIAEYQPNTDFILESILMNPKSSGKLTLKSNNPIDFPNIDIGILKDEQDIEDLYQAILFALKLIETKPFREINSTVYLNLTSCNHNEFGSKEFWICAIRHLAFASFHIAGTAKMGPKTDPYAVVNHNLQVYGMSSLRVVDCSVIPITITGHINAAAFMIGEKAADIIKKDHQFS